MLENSELGGWEKFSAMKSIRDSNIATKVDIIRLFRGKRVINEEQVILKRLLKLRGNNATKKHIIKCLIEKAVIYKKPELAQILHQQLKEVSVPK